jgi:hypothetical protein
MVKDQATLSKPLASFALLGGLARNHLEFTPRCKEPQSSPSRISNAYGSKLSSAFDVQVSLLIAPMSVF